MNKLSQKNIGVGAAIIVVAGVLILGYMGFVPWLSDVMGTNVIQDLNIKYSAQDYSSATSKLGVSIVSIPANPTPPESIIIENYTMKTVSLTSVELTALANELSKKWKDFPLSDIQMRINRDGTMEIVGKILLDRYDGFSKVSKVPEYFNNQVKPILSLIKSNPTFYTKCSLSMHSGVSDLRISSLKIQNIGIPPSDFTRIETSLNTYFNILAYSPRDLIKNIVFGDGVVTIEGQLPSVIKAVAP